MNLIERLKKEEDERQRRELASLNTDVNVFGNKKASSSKTEALNATAKSGTGIAGSTLKSTAGATNNKSTDIIERDWGLNTKAYNKMTNNNAKVSVPKINKSTDVIDRDWGLDVAALDNYLSQMKSEQKNSNIKTGANIYESIDERIKNDRYADTTIKVGNTFSKFG